MPLVQRSNSLPLPSPRAGGSVAVAKAARSCSGHRFLVLLAVLSVSIHLTLYLFASRLGEVLAAGKQAAATQRLVDPSDSRGSGGVLPLRPPPGAGSSVGGCEERKGLSVLLIHEHHLKAIGSDLRLLGLLLQLREQGHRTSLLFRGRTPREERSPPTSELYRIIGAEDLGDPLALGGQATPRTPPSIYEMQDLHGLVALAKQGWFDAVLCTFWFWRDPAPSAAELLLPTLLTHAPAGRRPFVAVLSDDAHSAKAAMMAGWEHVEERKALWRGKMHSLPPRQHAVYSLADAVVHISETDARLERAAPRCPPHTSAAPPLGPPLHGCLLLRRPSTGPPATGAWCACLSAPSRARAAPTTGSSRSTTQQPARPPRVGAEGAEGAGARAGRRAACLVLGSWATA